MRKKLLLVVCAWAMFNLASNAQTTATGKVVDEKGAAIAGATVLEKGTKNGTTTSSDGSYSIKVKSGASLVISAIGREARTIAAGSGSNVSLKATAAEIEELTVSTALGIKRNKNQLPYAAQVVSGEDANRARSGNFLNNLSGAAAGLDIRQTNTMGGSTNVVLRGNKSISGSNQALFVVDGVPYNNDAPATGNQRTGRGGYDYGNNAQDINPDDIESLTVLKGPAATALYGSLGFNGVILITTKKAKKGLGVTVNTGVSFTSVDKSTFPKYQNQYGGGYGLYYEDPTGYFLYRDKTDLMTPVTTNGALIVPTSEDASYGAKFDPNLQVYQWDAYDPNSPNYKKSKPWVAAANGPETFLQNATNFNNSVFIESATDKGSFKLGYTRNDEKGILPNSKINKNLLTFSASYNVTDKLTASASMNYSRTDGLGRYGTGYDDKNVMSSFRQWWQVNTDVKDLEAAYFRNKKNITWNWADPTDLVPIYWDNPYFVRYQNYQNDTRNRYFGNVALNYKANSWLNLMARASIDQYDALQETRAAVGTVGVSGYGRSNQNSQQTNFDLMANFDKNITSKLNFKGLLGLNIRKDSYNSIAAATNGGLAVPGIYALSNTKNPVNAPGEFEGKREVDGVYAGVTFTYNNMLTLDATIRRDASSTLPDGNNKYNYPAVSGGFIFSNLIKEYSWLSYGKVRANYAEVGKDGGYYQTKNTFLPQTAFGTENMFATPTTSNNPNLRPERTKSTEFGLELALFKNKVTLDVTYYDAKSFDQIIPVSISRATGYNALYRNSGTVQNKGVEISLGLTPVKTKDLTWNMKFNYTRNRNTVVELFDDGAGNKIDNIVLGSFQGGVTINAALGKPYGVIKGQDFKYFGDPNNEVRDPNMRIVLANGRYDKTASSNFIIGDPNPDFLASFRNNLTYKNFSFGFLIDIRRGGDVFSLDQYYGLATGLYPETAGLNDKGNELRTAASAFSGAGGILRQGVDATGKPNAVRASANFYGAYGYRYSPPAGFVYDGSFAKLREVSLGYQFPQSVVNKLKIFKDIQFTVVGRNLWIISKNLPYSDPEETYGAGNLQGYQGNAYPANRTVSANFKFTF
jgi:TonB-linked SusC/RagA family outer membrane protein